MKKRYYHDLTRWDLPKKNGRSIYMGKIAGSRYDAYLDIDELTKHMIITGSTGGGKTITGQIIAEEALAKEISLLVVDPTAQWTGFIRGLDEDNIKKRYGLFGMKKADARGYPTRIIDLRRGMQADDPETMLREGKLCVLNAESLAEKDIDDVITQVISGFFRKTPAESRELKSLIIFEEIHRILPRYSGGAGRGLIALERAVREFRKWGIGIILISQVLEDFAGEIRANIGTEMQLRTTYEPDLDKIRLKYGDEIVKSVVREETGTAMMHNSGYNIGKPFFINIRPPYHDVHRISASELDRYSLLSRRISMIEKEQLDEQDLFNLRLAKDGLLEANFTTAETYLGYIHLNR